MQIAAKADIINIMVLFLFIPKKKTLSNILLVPTTM